jgi:hypothetical protein
VAGGTLVLYQFISHKSMINMVLGCKLRQERATYP